MNKIRAVFLDLDGTLLSFKTHLVPKSARDALKRAKAQGLLLFVATGRHRQEVEQIETLDLSLFSGFLTQNGQYCYAPGRVLYKNPIHRHDVGAMVDYLAETGESCMFNMAGDVFINTVDALVVRTHKAIDTEIPPVGDMQRALREEVYQMVLYGDMPHAGRALARLPHCVGTCSNGNAVDILPRDGGKQVGMCHVMELFGLNVAEVLAVGDGDNDTEMLRSAGFSAAMGDGTSAALKAAGYVAAAPDDGGIAEVFEQFVF